MLTLYLKKAIQVIYTRTCCQVINLSRAVRLRKGKGKSKDKGHPRIGDEGPEGEQWYSSTLSLTSALDGVDGQRHAPAALPTGKRPGSQEAGWVPGPVWTGAENLASHRDSIPGPSSPQPVTIRTELTRCAITHSTYNYCLAHCALFQSEVCIICYLTIPVAARSKVCVCGHSLVGIRVRIPPVAWMFVPCECSVLSGRGLCYGSITRPEESYRAWCV